MEIFLAMMAELFGWMKLELTVYGFTFTFLEVFMWSAVAVIALRLATFIFGDHDE